MNAVTQPAETTSPKKRVLIVGGGLAGLATAECLARNHSDRFEISLLEAKRTTGGRAGSFQDSKTLGRLITANMLQWAAAPIFWGFLRGRVWMTSCIDTLD